MKWREKKEAEKGGKGKVAQSELGGCGSHWSLAEEPALSLKCRAQGICRASDLNHAVHPLFCSAHGTGLEHHLEGG